MKKFVSWDSVENFIDRIIDKYEDTEITGIYALPRGGLVLGVILSHRMNLPLLSAPFKGCLIIDDICDTGESLIHYVNNSCNPEEAENYHIATMYYKKNNLNIVPEFWGFEKGNDWIVFPWENKED